MDDELQGQVRVEVLGQVGLDVSVADRDLVVPVVTSVQEKSGVQVLRGARDPASQTLPVETADLIVAYLVCPGYKNDKMNEEVITSKKLWRDWMSPNLLKFPAR